ncbi:hypothetical protein ACGO3R_10610 [Lactococcus lactis]
MKNTMIYLLNGKKITKSKNITVTEEEEKDLQDNIDSDLEAMNNENSEVDNSTAETDKIAETEAKEVQVEAEAKTETKEVQVEAKAETETKEAQAEEKTLIK